MDDLEKARHDAEPQLIVTSYQQRESCRLTFEPPDAMWDASSILELRRIDSESWKRFAKLFDRFTTLRVDASLEEVAALVRWYHGMLRHHYEESSQRLETAWLGVHENWMSYLDDIFGTIGGAEPVRCYGSISLLSPRHLQDRRFSVPFYVALRRQMAICAHEMLHFRYFEWLAKARPAIPVNEYDAPHHPWRVSEVVASVMSNDDLAVRCFGPGADTCYACPDEILVRVRKAWKSHRKSGGRFDDFYERVSALIPPSGTAARQTSNS